MGYVDATKSQQLGKYVNDSIRRNCKVTEIDINGIKHLRIFSLQDINKGTELRYNYCAGNLWWDSQVNTS